MDERGDSGAVEQDRSWQIGVLRQSAFALLCCVPLYWVFFLLAGVAWSFPVLVIAASGVAVLPVFPLAQRGRRLDLLGNYTIAILWLVLLLVGWTTGGSSSPTAYWLAALPLMALLLVGWRSALAWAAVGFAHAWGMQGWQSGGHAFPQVLPPSWIAPYQLWAQVTLAVLLVAMGLVYQHGRESALRSERERSDELARSERRFRALIESLPLAVVVHRQGVIVYVNAAALEMLGYARADELEGEPITTVASVAGREAEVTRLEAAVERGEVVRLSDESFLRKDGSQLAAEVTAFAADFDGVPAVVTIAADESERKRLTAQLMQMDRMMAVGTLAAGVAHEINNPLTFVGVNTRLARDVVAAAPGHRLRPDEAAEVIEALDEAGQGVDRIAGIVTDLMTFSSANEEQLAPVDVAAILDAALNLAQNQIKHRAQLVRDYAEGVPLVAANAARLGQVFLNLLVNAAQAIAEGAARENSIVVRLRHLDQGVVVEVSDSGAGMDAKTLKQVFDPFFTTKPVGEGTGLGLAICRRLLATMGGRLEVESEPQVGSTFRVTLPPATSVEIEVCTTPRPTAGVVGQVRVLVLDDEPAVANTLARLLRKHYEVSARTDGAAALAELEAGAKWDVIVCDLMMPNLSGVELHAQLLERDETLASRVIFMTGGAFTSRARAFLDSVDNPVLHKPPKLEELLTTIEAVARRGAS